MNWVGNDFGENFPLFRNLGRVDGDVIVTHNGVKNVEVPELEYLGGGLQVTYIRGMYENLM